MFFIMVGKERLYNERAKGDIGKIVVSYGGNFGSSGCVCVSEFFARRRHYRKYRW